ncbi:esterase/lipase family protein [Nocardia sp. NPDC057227]|uniref:esterase/lipase family protein n=1 Tax=Nocardia sp. NPDC057227 TaxID=3346056 RepID=UPI00362BDC8B
MHRGQRRHYVRAAIITGTALFGIAAVGIGPAAADPDQTSGSSATGSTGGSVDTVGFGPVQTSWAAATRYARTRPDVAPPGTNDWSCLPSAAHPRPVLLVHGTWSNAYGFAGLSGPLAAAGYCLFTFNYGAADLAGGGGVMPMMRPAVYGSGDIAESARQLARFVERVLAATGASAVDIVGHSQGGPMSRWYLRYEGGAAVVRREITIGATNHGTTMAGIGAIGQAATDFGGPAIGPVVGRATSQQIAGSEFLTALNAGGDTVPGVEYTVIGTRYDTVSTPYEATFLEAGPGAPVTNITLQDGCEQDRSDHFEMVYSPRTLSIVLAALDPGTGSTPTCTAHG